MSRKKAKALNMPFLKKKYTSLNMNLQPNSDSYREESPEAYKDIRKILSEIEKRALGIAVSHFSPFLNVKDAC